MILVEGSIRIPPERLADALPAMRAMIEASRAEPACLGYSYAADILDAELIRVSEIWRDRAGFDAHVRSDHLTTWRSQWTRFEISGRELRLYETDGPEPA